MGLTNRTWAICRAHRQRAAWSRLLKREPMHHALVGVGIHSGNVGVDPWAHLETNTNTDPRRTRVKMTECIRTTLLVYLCRCPFRLINTANSPSGQKIPIRTKPFDKKRDCSVSV